MDYFEHIHPSDKVLARIKDVVINDKVVTVQVRTNKDWNEYFVGSHELDDF